MPSPPAHPKIYHITHVHNLARIADTGLLSDARIVSEGGPEVMIGMSAIKKRRIEELPVDCVPGTKVGDFVPFYFCPRSVMLFVIHCANHPDLSYREGQEPIVHLEADLHRVVQWAQAQEIPWAFSLSNAGARYAEFRDSLEALDEISWAAVAATDFRSADVKEGKQAELLVHGSFPFELVERVGVRDRGIQARAAAALGGKAHRPPVVVLPGWYF